MKRSYDVPVTCTLALILPLAAFFATAHQTNAEPAAPSSSDRANGVEKVVTEADNGSSVTLNLGEVLVVRLKETPATGFSRALVAFPDMPVRLLSHQLLSQAPVAAGGAPVVGAPRIGEWKFVASDEASFGRAVWLKFLQLRPFAKGVDSNGLWEIKVTVPKTPNTDQ